MLACYTSFLSQLTEQWASNATAQLLNVAIMEVLLSPRYLDSSPAYLSWRMAGHLNTRSINFFQITEVASVLHLYLHITEWQETVHALRGGSRSIESRLPLFPGTSEKATSTTCVVVSSEVSSGRELSASRLIALYDFNSGVPEYKTVLSYRQNS